VTLKRLILAGIIGAAAILGATLPASAAPAHHAAKASPYAASGWIPRLLRAESGGGCALPQPARLDPVLSDPCPSAVDWYVRDLSGSGYNVGDKIEFVNTSMNLALGFSGGQFKMETPRDSSTYLIIGSVSPDGSWVAFYDSSNIHLMAPNGKGLPLKALTGGPAFPADGWQICINASCTL
jgi:hypothetical protein